MLASGQLLLIGFGLWFGLSGNGNCCTAKCPLSSLKLAESLLLASFCTVTDFEFVSSKRSSDFWMY
jgi:hypothetical protein